MASLLRRRKVQLATMLLTAAVLIVAANWYLRPQLYPNYAMGVPAAMITVGVAFLLIFGAIDSVRRRLRIRRRKESNRTMPVAR